MAVTGRPVSLDGVGPSCVALPPGPWATVLDFLVQRFGAVPRAEWCARLSGGRVIDAGGTPLPLDAPYRPHAKLYYYRSVADEATLPFQEEVLYQDEHLVVADKPHFLPVTPGGRHVRETLLGRLKRRLGIDTLSPIHRIDRETAGLVAFSVQAGDRGRYHALFRERAVDKRYEAIAPWRPGLAFPLHIHSRLVDSPTAFMQVGVAEGEPNAETHVDLLEVEGGLGRYALRPVTGRRHQLRVHMASLGCPIVGDRIYPTLRPDAPHDLAHPLRLLARHLAFTCPVTGRVHAFESRRTLVF